MSAMAFLADMIDHARLRASERRNQRELIHIALTFNRRHTFPHGSCNTVHASTSHNFLTGLQYPGCCNFGAGHRLYRDHATGMGM
jgi:hypothetical protein